MQNVKLPLMVFSSDTWTDPGVKHFDIDKDSDVLNLKDVSEELCHEEGQNQCEIFLRIANTMDREIDLTLTLMVKDSVIELKDGIWQTYSINSVAKTSHFYFLPKEKNSSISIMFKSTFV